MRRSASTARFALGAVSIASALLVCVPAAAELLPVKPNVSQSSVGNSRTADVEHARIAYRASLESQLREKQARQTATKLLLDAQEARLGVLYKQLVVLTQSTDADDTSGGDSGGDPLVKEVSPTIKASRAYAIETYRASVLRESLQAINRDIDSINETLKRLD